MYITLKYHIDKGGFKEMIESLESVDNLMLLRFLLKPLWAIYSCSGISHGRSICSSLLEATIHGRYKPLLPNLLDNKLLHELADNNPPKLIDEAIIRHAYGELPIKLDTLTSLYLPDTVLALSLLSHLYSWHYMPNNYILGKQLIDTVYLFIPEDFHLKEFDGDRAKELIQIVKDMDGYLFDEEWRQEETLP